MGEYVVGSARDVLVCIGLGSCIGLTLLDRGGRVGGLAHVMLPISAYDADAQPGKFADTAVPALIDAVVAIGGRRRRLEAVLVGGAQMFSFAGSPSRDIGGRNAAAVGEALAAARIPVIAAATGGTRGRSMVYAVGEPEVIVREAAGSRVALLGARAQVAA